MSRQIDQPVVRKGKMLQNRQPCRIPRNYEIDTPQQTTQQIHRPPPTQQRYPSVSSPDTMLSATTDFGGSMP
jgi:hypothetical protein